MSQTSSIRPLVAGNWKMNGLRASLAEVDALKAGLAARAGRVRADVMLCPPATLVAAMSSAVGGSAIAVGGQDCHAKASGAHTGDIAAEMLRDAGASAVIVGHSERRADHGENDATVRAKAEAAHRAGLVAIVCVGETADQRKAGETLAVVRRQLQGSIPDTARAATTIIAYEPVWAIGTGLTPTAADVAEVHAMMREALVTRFAGDGGAWYHVGEIETAVRWRVPVVLLVNDNRSLNQGQQPYEAAYGGQLVGKHADLWQHRDVDFARLAESMGATGIRVERPADFAPALTRALENRDGPTVLDVVTDIDAMAPLAVLG